MQNTCVLGVSVGESFAEYSLLSNSKPLAQKRVYLARESLKQTLLQFLSENKENTPQKAFISLRVPKKLLDYHLSGAVAHITTEGLEHWLSLNGSGKELTQKDLLFSVRERVLANGQLESALDLEGLEAIAAKLLLMDCKKACLHFLHSQTNPQNLRQAQELLHAKGIETFVPATSDTPNEVERWNKNALNATITSVYGERKAEILNAFEGTLSAENIFFLDSEGQPHSPEQNLALDGHFSALTAIGKIFGETQKSDVLHLSLEGFTLISQDWSSRWESDWGPVALKHLRHHSLGIQPTLGVHLNIFGHFDFISQQEGWEPGPMFLGRGQKISLLDLWAENAKLTALAGLQDRLAAQGIQRCKNSLLVLAKNSRSRNTDLGHVTKEIQSLTLQRLAVEAFLHRGSEKMQVTGPLAPVFANAFKKDSRTSIHTEDFCESTATALWGSQVLRGAR